LNESTKSPRAILEYPQFVKGFAWLHLALCTFLGGAVLFTIYSAIFAGSPEIRAQFGSIALMIVFLFGFNLCAFYWILLPKAASRFLVFDDRLEIHRGTNVTVVPFTNIAKVFGRVFPFAGGSYGFVMKTGKIHAFSASLRGSEKLLDAVSEFDPALKSSFTELRTNLIVCAHGYDRFYEYFSGNRAFFTFIHLGLVPFLFSAYMVGRQSSMMTIAHPKLFFVEATFGIYLCVVTLAVTFSVALNWIIDLPTLERMIEDPVEDSRDLKHERAIFADALPVYLFLLFSLMSLYNRFDLNTLSRTEVPTDIPHLGYHAGQTLWIDGRANCLNCRHSLQEGDAVIFIREKVAVLGRLVALPGSPVPAPGGENPLRTPASELPIVPFGKAVLRSNPDGNLDQLVDLKDIRGRVSDSAETFFHAND
jgi:hypothetical protein